MLRSTCTRLKLPSDFRVHLLRHEPQRRDHATGRSLTVQWIRRDSRGRPPQSARVAGARRERQAFCPSLLSPAGGRALGRCVSPGDSFLSHFCASFLEPPSFFLSSSLVSAPHSGFRACVVRPFKDKSVKPALLSMYGNARETDVPELKTFEVLCLPTIYDWLHWTRNTAATLVHTGSSTYNTQILWLYVGEDHHCNCRRRARGGDCCSRQKDWVCRPRVAPPPQCLPHR